MSFLDNLATFIAEHKRKLVTVSWTLLADTDTLGTVGPQFVALDKADEHLWTTIS